MTPDEKRKLHAFLVLRGDAHVRFGQPLPFLQTAKPQAAAQTGPELLEYVPIDEPDYPDLDEVVIEQDLEPTAQVKEPPTPRPDQPEITPTPEVETDGSKPKQRVLEVLRRSGTYLNSLADALSQYNAFPFLSKHHDPFQVVSEEGLDNAVAVIDILSRNREFTRDFTPIVEASAHAFGFTSLAAIDAYVAYTIMSISDGRGPDLLNGAADWKFGASTFQLPYNYYYRSESPIAINGMVELILHPKQYQIVSAEEANDYGYEAFKYLPNGRHSLKGSTLNLEAVGALYPRNVSVQTMMRLSEEVTTAGDFLQEQETAMISGRERLELLALDSYQFFERLRKRTDGDLSSAAWIWQYERSRYGPLPAPGSIIVDLAPAGSYKIVSARSGDDRIEFTHRVIWHNIPLATALFSYLRRK